MVLKVIFAASLLGILYHGAAEEQLVLPEGEEHSILCTAPDEENYLITWVANVGPVGDGFVVGEEEILDDETKGKKNHIYSNRQLEQHRFEMCCF